MAWDNLEKNPEPRPAAASRLPFMRSKKGIAAFTGMAAVLIAAIIVIALAATGSVNIGGSSDEPKSEEQLAIVSSPTSMIVATTGATAAAGEAQLTTPTPSSTETSSTATSTTSKSTKSESTTSEETSASSTKPTSTSSESSTSSDTPSGSKSGAGSTDTPLRIMALGASIVKGETSPEYVGFRKPMRDELIDLGFTVNMVGSVKLGDFDDNDVEAYGGKKILEMHNYAKKAVPKTLPNLFLINLGTNNLLQNKDVDKVGAQMEDLIDYLLTASKDSTVILSTMLTNKVGDLETTVLDMNKQYREVAKKLQADGKPVVLAEMHPSEGIAGVPTPDQIGPDGSHPTVEGYKVMAHIFVQAIEEANRKGLIHKPAKNGIPDDGASESSKS